MRFRRWARGLAALAVAAPAALEAQSRPSGVLAPAITPLFEGRAWRDADWGALVLSLTRGDTVFSYHADSRFRPASNAKLFTTAAALHYLGPDFRFETVLFGDGPVRSHTLHGNLVLYGTGDPTFGLDTVDLAPFADSVVLAGINTVAGDVVGDASYLGSELTGPGWSPDNLDQGYAAPPSALGVAENVVHIAVRPGRPGTRPTITVDPPTDYYAIRNLVRTRWRRTRIRVERGPADSVVTLRGSIWPRRGPWRTDIVVRHPARFAAALLRQLLEARGVTVVGRTVAVTADSTGRARRLRDWNHAPGSAPFPGTLALRESGGLGALITTMIHRSDNLSAELVFRSIGRALGGAGTFASGANAVTQFLATAVGIPPASVRIADGSGLSRQDEASPRALIRLLAYEWRAAPDEQAPFWHSLPTVGDGFGRRMVGTAADGRLRAKTGTLKNASALTGYVTTDGGEVLAFSIIVNHIRSIRAAQHAEDQVGELLARWQRGT